MKARTVLIVGGIAALGIIALTVNKVLVLKDVFSKMKIWPSDISNFKITLSEISFNLDFMIQNPTNESFAVTGASIVRLKRVTAFKNGVYLGQAEVNLAEIEIPANSTIKLENLPFKLSLQSVLNNLANITNFDVTALTTGLSIEAVVDFLGQEYVIES